LIPLKCKKSVDFPAPFLPKRATISPLSTLKLMLFNALVPSG